jgi:hypothetical protein
VCAPASLTTEPHTKATQMQSCNRANTPSNLTDHTEVTHVVLHRPWAHSAFWLPHAATGEVAGALNIRSLCIHICVYVLATLPQGWHLPCDQHCFHRYRQTTTKHYWHHPPTCSTATTPGQAVGSGIQMQSCNRANTPSNLAYHTIVTHVVVYRRMGHTVHSGCPMQDKQIQGP